MTHEVDLETVTENTSITDLVALMFDERQIGYPVVRNGDLIGMVTLDDAGAIEEVERDAYRVQDVMSTDIKTIAPDADAMEAFQQMQQNGVGRLPVVDETGNLINIISRADLMRAFNVIQKSVFPPSVGQSESELSLV